VESEIVTRKEQEGNARLATPHVCGMPHNITAFGENRTYPRTIRESPMQTNQSTRSECCLGEDERVCQRCVRQDVASHTST
jgi:hypothetical protein